MMDAVVKYQIEKITQIFNYWLEINDMKLKKLNLFQAFHAACTPT